MKRSPRLPSLVDQEISALPIESDDLRGRVLLFVLAALADGPLHGYGIVRKVEERSSGQVRLLHGSLYPLLHALEEEEYVTSSWQLEAEPDGEAAGKPRRVYRLTDDFGRRLLAQELRRWERMVETVNGVVGRSPDASAA